jgi:hypothetical protein
MFELIVRPVLAAAAVLSGSGSAQPVQAPIVEAGFTIHAVARRLASPPDAPPALHWVADPFPGAPNVTISHPPLKAAVVDALTQLAAGEPGCPIWVLENSQTCTLSARLERRLTAFSFHVRDDVALLDPPDAEGKELSLTLRVDYLVSPAGQAASLVRSLVVRVATERGKQGAAATALTLTARDAAERVGTPPPPAFLDVPITVRLTEDDRVQPGGALFPIDPLQNELFRAGLNALRVEADGGLALNQPAPGNEGLTAIDEQIRLMYRLERPAWPAARASTTHNGEDFFIDLTGLRFVSRVQVEVHPAVIERENGRFTFQGTTPAGEAKLAALRTAAAQGARARVNARRSLEGTIPTAALINDLIDDLRQQPTIGFREVLSDPNGTVTFSAVYRDVDSELGAKVDLRAALDPEQFLTGAGTLHEHNLLYALLHRNIQEDVDLTAVGGPEVQNVNLDVSVSRERGTAHVLTYGFTARTFFSRDTNQRFGNLPAIRGRDDGDLHLVDREWGEVPKLFFQYEWRGSWSNRLRWEGGLDWRQVLIRPQIEALPPSVDAHLTAWDNSLEHRLAHDFTPAGENPGGGVGEVALATNGVFRRATRQLSGDFDFSRPQVSSTIEGLLGWRTRRELLVRHAWIAGSAGEGTPLFQLYRLGGSTNVRGLEEGEYVGRSLRAQQFTVGIGLPVFWPALSQPAGPSPLAGSYLTMFYDRGRVTLDDLTRDADGYGVGIEIRNLRAGNQRAHIAIGWARSPQSFLHRLGVMTIGVHFSL